MLHLTVWLQDRNERFLPQFNANCRNELFDERVSTNSVLFHFHKHIEFFDVVFVEEVVQLNHWRYVAVCFVNFDFSGSKRISVFFSQHGDTHQVLHTKLSTVRISILNSLEKLSVRFLVISLLSMIFSVEFSQDRCTAMIANICAEFFGEMVNAF